ncbi:MAG: hypothetical protein D3923_11390 [Candidatus Electrothrix sp. AR3]|nr:hypothetical protein [Candidatus Electrothrix sp. AR3]
MVRREYPDKSILDIDLAVLYLQSGHLEQAIELLRWAYQQDATDVYSTFQLAKAMEQQGDMAAAERLYLEVADFIPEYSQLYYALGRLKSQQGKIGISNFYLAKHYLYEGRISYAKQYLKRAKNDQSIPPSLQKEAGAILERLKKLEDAS